MTNNFCTQSKKEEAQTLIENNITTSGVFLIKQNSPNNICINTAGKYFLIEEYLHSSKKIDIEIMGKGVQLFYVFLGNNKERELSVVVRDGASATVFCAAKSKEWQKNNIKIHGNLEGVKSKCRIVTFSVVENGWIVEINSIVWTSQDAVDVCGEVIQKGFFLSKGWKIIQKPILLPKTSQSSLRHSTSLQQFSPESQFYLCSRGINASKARCILLSSAFLVELEPLQKASASEYCRLRSFLLHSFLDFQCSLYEII